MIKHRKLAVRWSKRENDLEIVIPQGFQTKADAHYLSSVFSADVLTELDRRGYDLSTLKFEVSPKAGNPRFAASRPEGMSEQEALKAWRES